MFKRLFMSKTNRPHISFCRLIKFIDGKNDNIVVNVGTMTDDKRVYEVPAMKVTALRFTETAKARILKAGEARANIHVSAATEHGCLAVNAPTANTIIANEHGIALLTSMARNVTQADASMKARFQVGHSLGGS
ncbi:60S ribosomal protein L18-3-like [Dioscorea cayenensis subsp. rotundata]|uniref:60S ribosomal protein L18-3-like n=1 Tax=Dioscorea cayennensis subsp. rotundata TaxID=55577 RepID=A0AB40BVC7_DIOCR|nr:60S ribosomal protein L18-3-like [Dioscorea cayenensis subsp. rotundata]